MNKDQEREREKKRKKEGKRGRKRKRKNKGEKERREEGRVEESDICTYIIETVPVILVGKPESILSASTYPDSTSSILPPTSNLPPIGSHDNHTTITRWRRLTVSGGTTLRRRELILRPTNPSNSIFLL